MGAKEETERKAKEEAEIREKRRAELKAEQEIRRKAKEEADAKEKQELERKAKEKADLKAKQEAERKAKEKADFTRNEKSSACPDVVDAIQSKENAACLAKFDDEDYIGRIFEVGVQNVMAITSCLGGPVETTLASRVVEVEAAPAPKAAGTLANKKLRKAARMAKKAANDEKMFKHARRMLDGIRFEVALEEVGADNLLMVLVKQVEHYSYYPDDDWVGPLTGPRRVILGEFLWHEVVSKYGVALPRWWLSDSGDDYENG